MAVKLATLPAPIGTNERHGLLMNIGPFQLWLFTLSALTVWLSTSSSKAQAPDDYRCIKDSDIRRIEIRFEDELQKLPCRVIYRPETETDTVGIVSWRGLPDLQSCKAQATEIIDRLEDEGWACSTDQGLDIARSDQPDPEAAEEILPQASDGQAIPEEPLEQGDEAISPEIADAETDRPARLLDNPDLATLPASLVTTIERDLAELDTTLDGQLEALVAGYSDLDGDEFEDAVILYTYISPQPAYRQFLAAYMFDGEIYQMRATKPIGGNITGTSAAEVEAIEEGVIHLSLRVFNPGDAACCPTGKREMAVTLRDLDLVEIDKDELTR